MFAKTLTQRGNTQLVSRCPPAYVFPSQGCLIPCISVLAFVSLPCEKMATCRCYVIRYPSGVHSYTRYRRSQAHAALRHIHSR